MNNAPSTLAELVAPFSEQEFITLLRDRKLTFLRGAGGARYSSLLTWNALLGMIERGEHPTGLTEFSLVKNSQVAPPERWLKRNPHGEGNVVDIPKLLGFVEHGFSLSISKIDKYAPHLNVLCQNIRATLHEQIKVGAIVTTGEGGAFRLHYDPEDLIILQIEGRKRWKIFGPPVVNPIAGLKPPPAPPEDMLLFDEVLAPGDFLFLPAGNWHRCENQSNRSLHLGIFFQPPSGLDVIKAITSILMADETLRAPLSRGAANPSAVETDIKGRATERIGELDLKAFLAEFGRQ